MLAVRHRVYRLRNRLTLLGLDLADWGVVVGTWLTALQTLGPLFGGRGRLLVAVLATFGVFRAWASLKDRVPEKFAIHLVFWLAEREINHVRPDPALAPVIVDPARIRALETPHHRTAREA